MTLHATPTLRLKTGPKRKGMEPLKEVQNEAELGKWSKKEEDMTMVSQLWANHLESVKAAAQPHRHQ